MTETTTDAIVVEFVSALHGLGPHTSFTLDAIAGAAGLYALRASDADVRLFLLDVIAAEYDYTPRIPAGVRAEIGAAEESVLRMFVVANPSDDGVHLNLRAPIVIHRETGRAAQVILEDAAYPIRARLGN